MHDDDDIYHDDGHGMKEHGEEEVATDDECVNVATHDDDDGEVEGGRDNVEGHPTGTAMDTADTLPEVPDTQVLEKDFEKAMMNRRERTRHGQGSWVLDHWRICSLILCFKLTVDFKFNFEIRFKSYLPRFFPTGQTNIISYFEMNHHPPFHWWGRMRNLLFQFPINMHTWSREQRK